MTDPLAVPLLSLRGASKVYEKDGEPVRALDGVDLDVARGDYVALLGPSGSGKSTLMHLIGCLDQPTAGSYRFAGAEVRGLVPDQLAALRRRIGFVFQAFHLLPGLTAQQNTALPLRYADVAPAIRMARAASMLARVGLGARLTHLPKELSGGQQQRVAIARALVTEPDLLLADEPTGNLDSRSGAEISELLEVLWREGRTLIVVTHDERLAARAKRVVRLLDGRVAERDLSGVGATTPARARRSTVRRRPPTVPPTPNRRISCCTPRRPGTDPPSRPAPWRPRFDRSGRVRRNLAHPIVIEVSCTRFNSSRSRR